MTQSREVEPSWLQPSCPTSTCELHLSEHALGLAVMLRPRGLSTLLERVHAVRETLMILGMEIGMIIFGIVTLTTGKLTLSKSKVVTGSLARHLGFLLLAPVPVAYTAHGFVHQ